MPVLAEITNTPEAWSERAACAATPWDAAGWSEHGQTARFEAVLAAVDAQPRERLLDYGCGVGRLVEFLPPLVDYIGYDRSPGMVERARDEYPLFRFQDWEPLLLPDVTVCVGPFNLPGRWTKQDTWHTLRRLWDKTGRALAVSLYSGDDDRCHIYTEDEVSKFARGETFHARVERHLPNDLLMVLRR